MISVSPKTFTEGGLADNFDGKILEAGTRLFDYGGKGTGNAAPALRLIIGLGKDYTEQILEQYYSAGSDENFMPSTGDEAFQSEYGAPEGETIEIGRGFDAVGDRQALNKSSNAGMLLLCLVNNGFPEPLLAAGDLHQALTGCVFHWKRQAQPERAGLANPEGGDKKKPRDILLVDRILQLADGSAPDGTAPAKPAAGKATTGAKTTTAKAAPAAGKTATSAAKPAAAPAAGGGALDEAAYEDTLQEIVVEALGEASGTLKKQALVPLLFKKIPKDAKFRTWATTRVLAPDFLGGIPGVEFAPETNTLQFAS